MKLNPVNRNILMRNCKDPRSLKRGSLDVLPTPEGAHRPFGLVVAVDPALASNPAAPKEGDVVYFRDGQQTPVHVDQGEVMLLVHESQILAVCPDANVEAEPYVVGAPASNIVIPTRAGGKSIVIQ
jgi:co-chaperonin GroES (HSP10)